MQRSERLQKFILCTHIFMQFYIIVCICEISINKLFKIYIDRYPLCFYISTFTLTLFFVIHFILIFYNFFWSRYIKNSTIIIDKFTRARIRKYITKKKINLSQFVLCSQPYIYRHFCQEEKKWMQRRKKKIRRNTRQLFYLLTVLLI